MTAPHPFRADAVDPGYRPRCLTCGRERHPSPLPVPRRPVDDRQQNHTTEESSSNA